MAEHHNHLTRDIRPPGQCPACDAYHARAGALGTTSQLAADLEDTMALAHREAVQAAKSLRELGWTKGDALTLAPPVNPLRLYTVAEAAALLGTGDDYVRGRIAAGDLAATELGTNTRAKTRVSAAELHRFIRSRTEEAR